MSETLKNSALGRKIAKERRARNWTQRDLAEKLHIHHSMITRWEKGQMLPREGTLEKIAEVLELTPTELLSASLDEPFVIPTPVNDPELQRLLSQLNTLGERDIDALKLFLDAVLTKNTIRRMVA